MMYSHNEFSSEGETELYGWSISDSSSTAGGLSDAPAQDILSDVDVGRPHVDRLYIDIMLNTLRAHVRHAARRLTVVQFAELRRRYDSVWLEVLEEL
jgi:hypothetical protein